MTYVSSFGIRTWCDYCRRRASVVVGHRLLCGDCYLDASKPTPDEATPPRRRTSSSMRDSATERPRA